MRRLFKITIILLILSVLAYFVALNTHNVRLHLFYAYTLHFSLWLLLLAAFVGGWATCWGYQFFTHPERLIQRFRLGSQKRQSQRWDDQARAFYDACTRYDFAKIRQSYQKLSWHKALPLHLRIQRLQMKRYEAPAAQIKKYYQELLQHFPQNLQVLLPYQELAIDLEDWGLVTHLSHEIQQVVPQHPKALEGLSKSYAARQEWKRCLLHEQALLAKFPKSAIAEQLLPQHEEHLLNASKEHPDVLEKRKLRYLPSSSRFQEKNLLAVKQSEIQRWQEGGQFQKAGRHLKKLYEETGAESVLEQLEKLYEASGLSPKILDIFYQLKNSDHHSIYVDLVLARILCRQQKFDEATSLLAQMNQQRIALPPAYYELQQQLATTHEPITST